MGWMDTIANMANSVATAFSPSGVNAGNVFAPWGATPTSAGVPAGVPGYSPATPMTGQSPELQQIMNPPSVDPNANFSAAPSSIPPPAAASAAGAPAAAGVPTAPNDYGNLLGKILGYGVKGGTGILGSLAKNPTDIASLLQAYQAHQLQQNLQNPAWVAQQAEAQRRKLNMATKARIARQVGGGLALQGLGGAPGMYSQAVAEATAPYEFQTQQDAQTNFLNSIGMSEQAYPLGGPNQEFSNFLQEMMLQEQQQKALS